MLCDRAIISWYDSPHVCRDKHFPPCGNCGIRQSRILCLLERNIYTEDGDYTASENKQQLVPDKDYLSPLTRVSQDTVESLFSSLDENNLPSRWQDFSDLMWKIERHRCE